MGKLSILTPIRVFYYFEKICSIPHGSGDMGRISDFCVEFAKEQGLKFIQDDAKNVIIYKPASKGYENSQPVILQGHLDMVCQKTPESKLDFSKDGLDIYLDGDYVKARNTTLGADNGIAVAMMLAILEDEKLLHPPIEAVFTTDEEIGMIGAGKLDMSNLSSKKMINLDMGKNDEAIVSCAGGVDVKISKNITRCVCSGKKVEILIDGLLGGHSGGMIDKGRVNANVLMGRILSYAKKILDFDILKICGGDKGNVIPSRAQAVLVISEPNDFIDKMEEYFEIIKKELSDREEHLNITIKTVEEGNFEVLGKKDKDIIIYLLTALPNGVIEMSKKIQNLVETSLNLGILKVSDNKLDMLYTLRSNKETALDYLQEKMFFIAEHNDCDVEALGHYPPWEYREDTDMQRLYACAYKEKNGVMPKIYAVHAGLECGIFSSKIKELDCISIGPDMFDIHTVNERLSISATEAFFEFLIHFISLCK